MAKSAKQLQKEHDAFMKKVRKIQQDDIAQGKMMKVPGLRGDWSYAKGGSIMDGYDY